MQLVQPKKLRCVVYYRGLESRLRRRCPWKNCGRPSHQTGKLCTRHRYANQKWGSPDAFNIARSSYVHLVSDALDYISTKNTEATKEALAAITRTLDPDFIPASRGYEKLHGAVSNLLTMTRKAKGAGRITAEELLAEGLALYRYWRMSPGLDAGSLYVHMVRAWLRLRPKAVYRSTISPRPPYPQIVTRAQDVRLDAVHFMVLRIGEGLRLYICAYYDWLDAQAKHEERQLRLAVNGFADQTEARDAEIAAAHERAAKAKPKLTAAQAQHPLAVPAELTPEERRQFVNEIITAAKNRMEATA